MNESSQLGCTALELMKILGESFDHKSQVICVAEFSFCTKICYKKKILAFLGLGIRLQNFVIWLWLNFSAFSVAVLLINVNLLEFIVKARMSPG